MTRAQEKARARRYDALTALISSMSDEALARASSSSISTSYDIPQLEVARIIDHAKMRRL